MFTLMLTFGLFFLYTKVSTGKNPVSSSILMVSPFLHRFHGIWTSGGVPDLVKSMSLSVALRGAVAVPLNSINSSKS